MISMENYYGVSMDLFYSEINFHGNFRHFMNK